MKIYVTQNSEYSVTTVGELEIIINEKGTYGILGFIEDKSDSTFEGEVHFISGDMREGKENLSQHLDKIPKRGKSIVAKLLDEDGRFVNTPEGIIITTPIQEIK